MLYLHTHPEPDDPFYLSTLEDDDTQPEPLHYGEDELSPEEFEEVLEEQNKYLNMDRIMTNLAAMGFTVCITRVD